MTKKEIDTLPSSAVTHTVKQNEIADSLFSKFKSIFIVAGGQIFGTGLGFLASVMVARLLKVEEFGYFSLFLVIMQLAVEFSGNFAVRTQY